MRGPYKKGTTVCASSCKVYKITDNTHDYLSVRRVCKHVPVASNIFPGSALLGVKRFGRKKRQVSAPIEATSVTGAPIQVT